LTASYATKIDGVLEAPSFSLPFTLDSQFDWLELTLSFSVKGWYSILIWDPSNSLRAQSLIISESKTITISSSSTETSFGAVTGNISAGEWVLEILSPTASSERQYTFEFIGGFGKNGKAAIEGQTWSDEGTVNSFLLNKYQKDQEINTETRWYKGDFHTHTTESDGKMTLAAGMEQAKKMNLDFFVSTDHNILPTKWVEDDMLVVPGVEITSSKGHFNALGLTKWVDWRPSSVDGGMETEQGMNRIIREVKASDAVVSMNHPMLQPWEWQYRNTLLADLDVIEIWNDPTYKDNPVATEQALQLWNTLWDDGHRIFGIGGSDSHLLPTESYEEGGPPSVIGDPATYVYCNGLSARTLLDGVKRGKAYVSRGPEFIINILVDGISYLPGSDLTDCFDGKEEVDVWYEVMPIKTPDYARIHWIKDGQIIKNSTLTLTGGKILQERFTLKSGETSWIRFEIRSVTGELLSFVNPIFTGKKDPFLKTWGDLLDTVDFSK
jgi:hypothetical protein